MQIVAHALVILGFLVLLIECKSLYLLLVIFFNAYIDQNFKLSSWRKFNFLLVYNIFSVDCHSCANLTSLYYGAVLRVKRICNPLLVRVLFMGVDGDFSEHINRLFVYEIF